MDPQDRLLTPTEVASLFRVDPKTVTRWAAAGKLSRFRTPGGHSRFRESDVRALLDENLVPQQSRSVPDDFFASTPAPQKVAQRNDNGG